MALFCVAIRRDSVSLLKFSFLSHVQVTPLRGFHTSVCLPSRLGLKNTTIAPLQRCKTPPNENSGYDTEQPDGEVPV